LPSLMAGCMHSCQWRSRAHDEALRRQRRGVMVSQHNRSSTSFFTSTSYGIQPSIYVLERCPRALVQAD
jgi:hypothetical protein